MFTERIEEFQNLKDSDITAGRVGSKPLEGSILSPSRSHKVGSFLHSYPVPLNPDLSEVWMILLFIDERRLTNHSLPKSIISGFPLGFTLDDVRFIIVN